MLAFLGFCFGAIIGSFLNVVILRRGARDLGGRSACGSCGRQLEWFELVPIASWIVLRGRCRTCGSVVSVQYPLVEAGTGLLFALIITAPVPLVLQFAALAVAMLSILIAVYDVRHTIIPDEWAAWFGVSALVYAGIAGAFSVAPWQAFLAGPVVAAPFFLLWLISRGAWMGLGDAKLGLGIGWFLGVFGGVQAVFLSFMIGALISVCILLPLPHLIHALKRRGIRLAAQTYTMSSEVPFGPFLLAAMWLVWAIETYGIQPPLILWI